MNHELLSAILRLITTTPRPFRIVFTRLDESAVVAALAVATTASTVASGAMRAAQRAAAAAAREGGAAKLKQASKLFLKKKRGARRESTQVGTGMHHHIEGTLLKKSTGALGRFQPRFFSTSGRA